MGQNDRQRSLGIFRDKICRVVPEQYGERCKTSASGVGLPGHQDTVPIC